MASAVNIWYSGLRRKNEFTIRYSNGHFKIEAFGHEMLFYEWIYCDYEPPIRGYFTKWIPTEGDIVVDGGAYLGSFAILASKLVGNNGLVLAFEPIERNFIKLVKNLKLNKVSNVLPIQKGLWSFEGKIPFVDVHDGMSSCVMDNLNMGKPGIMNVTTIRAELERLGISGYDFMKLDIEGAEIYVIEDLLINGPLKVGSKMAIASYHEVDGIETRYRIESLFRDFGIRDVITVVPEHWTTLAKM